MLCENNLSAADIAAVTRSNDSNGWGGGFGMEALIAIVILFLFPMMFGGFGFGGGFGGFGGFGGSAGAALASGALTRADLCSEFNFNGLENAVRGIKQGICDSTFALNNTMTNGFHGVDNAIYNLGYNTQQGFNQTNIALMQGQNALSTQLANCCCENRQGQADIKYQMATDTCAIQNTIQNTTRDIIDNQNCNSRAILDFLTQDKISSLQNEVQSLRLAASQSNQNAVLMAAMEANKADILRKTGAECPTAAYIVQPPTPVTFATNCNGQAVFGNNCGCGSNCNTACGF